MKLQQFFCTGLSICLSLSVFLNANASENDSVMTQRVLLFDHGDMGSRFWRIPALASTSDGTVIAVADKRNDSNRDLPNNIDIAIRRSHDNGATWDAPRIILPADSVGGYGDPALAYHYPSGDLVIVTAHGNGIWESTPDNHTRLTVIRSSDNGETWSEPVDFTDQIFSWEDDGAPVKALSAFATSGTLLCDADGKLMFVLVANPTLEMWGPLYAYVVSSDDGGYNWTINPNPVDLYADESKIAQLADGSYYMSLRNRRRHARKYSRSTDGVHWTEPTIDHQLVDPACNGDLIAITPEQMVAFGLDEYVPADMLKNGLLLHSMAYHPTERENVTVLASNDLGITWRPIYTVAPGRSAYSAIHLLPNGQLGCFTEEECDDGGFVLWFTSIDLKKALNQ